MGAGLLVELVVESARDEVPVAAGEPEGEEGGVGDVEDGLLEGYLRREGLARLAGADGMVGDDGERLQACGGLEACGVTVGADDEASVERGGDVVGVALDGCGAGEQGGVEHEQVIGGEQTGDDRRGASTRVPR